jgi:hypothetical protein
MPFYPPLLEGGNPVVVIARILVDILVVHSCAKHGKKLISNFFQENM